MLPAGHDSAFLRWFSGRPLVHGFNKGIVLERENSGTCRIDCPNSVILESNAPIPSLCEIKRSTLIFSSWEMSRALEHETILSFGYRAFRYAARTQPFIPTATSISRKQCSLISEIASIGVLAVTAENPDVFMVRASRSSCWISSSTSSTAYEPQLWD
jgi:hypothetical protein